MKKRTFLLFLITIVLNSCSQSDPPVYEDGILRLNDKNIDQAISDSKNYFLVHFSSYDPNCGYCIVSNDRVFSMASRHSNNLQLARITWEPWNSAQDVSPDVIENYWIRGLPTLILYRDGEEIWRGTGSEKRVYSELLKIMNECCKEE